MDKFCLHPSPQGDVWVSLCWNHICDHTFPPFSPCLLRLRALDCPQQHAPSPEGVQSICGLPCSRAQCCLLPCPAPTGAQFEERQQLWSFQRLPWWPEGRTLDLPAIVDG